jgi:hypothetical protein
MLTLISNWFPFIKKKEEIKKLIKNSNFENTKNKLNINFIKNINILEKQNFDIYKMEIVDLNPFITLGEEISEVPKNFDYIINARLKYHLYNTFGKDKIFGAYYFKDFLFQQLYIFVKKEENFELNINLDTNIEEEKKRLINLVKAPYTFVVGCLEEITKFYKIERKHLLKIIEEKKNNLLFNFDCEDNLEFVSFFTDNRKIPNSKISFLENKYRQYKINKIKYFNKFTESKVILTTFDDCYLSGQIETVANKLKLTLEEFNIFLETEKFNINIIDKYRKTMFDDGNKTTYTCTFIGIQLLNLTF